MKTLNSPLVSVLMSTYNRVNSLKKTIENIFKQDYENMELIVINDGSTDHTSALLEEMQDSFNMVVVNNKQNLGLQKSLNIGIRKSSGKYIARIDDHDEWILSNKISKQVSFMESNPRVGVVGTGFKTGNKTFTNPLTNGEIRKQILKRSPFCHVSVLISKNVLDQTQGYNESLPYSEDWDLWLQIGKLAKLANLPDIAVATNDADNSLSKEFYLKQIPLNRQLVKQYCKDYPSCLSSLLYHQFLLLFFSVFPINGSVHKLMRHVFLRYFSLTTN